MHALALLAAFVAPATSAAAASASAPLRIGMVADSNGVYDRSFNELAYAGVRMAALKLGAFIDVRASPTASSYEPNLRFMAQQGYDLVIAIGSDLDGVTTQNWRQPQPPSVLAINVDGADASACAIHVSRHMLK